MNTILRVIPYFVPETVFGSAGLLLAYPIKMCESMAMVKPVISTKFPGVVKEFDQARR